jgi:hypothetical protein
MQGRPGTGEADQRTSSFVAVVRMVRFISFHPKTSVDSPRNYIHRCRNLPEVHTIHLEVITSGQHVCRDKEVDGAFRLLLDQILIADSCDHLSGESSAPLVFRMYPHGLPETSDLYHRMRYVIAPSVDCQLTRTEDGIPYRADPSGTSVILIR